MSEPFHVAVIGGGISGLTTAYYLTHQKHAAPLQVTLIEADTRLGGKIRTEPFADIPVDTGPDAFLARVPWVVKLCRELGLDDELIVPATGKTWLWTRNKLRALPDGLVMGIPTRVFSVARSGILSPPGILRAGLDLVLPRQHLPADPSVAQVIGSRLGREVVERMVEPLLGGIHAGHSDYMSLAATAPHLAAAAKQHRSLIWGLHSQKQPAQNGNAPAFYSLKGGLERLVERLYEELHEVDIRTGTRITTVTRKPGNRYHLTCSNGSDLTVDGIVLAIPAWEAANILQSLVPAVTEDLMAIRYASVVVVTMGYAPSAFPRPLDGSGFLPPRIDNHLLTACSWATNKWPELTRSGLIILRCSTGRFGDDRAMQLNDDELIKQVHAELVAAMDVRSQPSITRVAHWPRSFAQYEPGHQERITRVEQILGADLPGLLLAGSAFHGTGIAACVHDGEVTATRMQTYLERSGKSYS